ncbi:MAG: hypothetical protein HC927_09015, partial [Deltaproteobacteria bacterium]|nr:hypothetical protein [Deltaproteobacteria bacterium]
MRVQGRARGRRSGDERPRHERAAAARAEAGDELRRLIVLANLSGIANALLLATINAAAQGPAHADLRGLLIFVLALVVFTIVTRHVNHRLTALFEAALHRIKVRVGELLVRSELDALERIRAAEICERITENMVFISDRSGLLATLLQSGLIVVFLACYVAWLSPVAFALLVLLGGLGLGIFISFGHEYSVQFRRIQAARVELFERLGDLVYGFKQLRFGRQVRADARAELALVSERLRQTGVAANRVFADNMLVGEVLLYALLGTLAYGLP